MATRYSASENVREEMEVGVALSNALVLWYASPGLVHTPTQWGTGVDHFVSQGNNCCGYEKSVNRA